MSQSANPMLSARHDQMFPTLAPEDIDRLHRFGEARSYAAGECIVKTGDVAPGLIVILAGKVEVAQGGALGQHETIVKHEPRQFVGELAQLSAHPSLVDVEALEPVEALIIRSDKLRDLMVQEAGLGERIMRALILRRVGLLESGISGPIIIGRTGHADLLRLQGFLARNGEPHRVLDPDSDSCAKTLIERFHVDLHHLPIVLCPNGKLLRNPSENELARCIGLVRSIDATKVYDVAIVGAGPAGLATAVYAASEGLSVIVLDSRAFGGQAGASARIENYLGFPTGISGMALMARAYNQAHKFGVETAIPDQVHQLSGRTNKNGECYLLGVGDDETVQARTVVVASGARYRRLELTESRAIRGVMRALLGVADRGSALRWSGSCAGRRGQFGRAGGCLSGEPGEKGVVAGAWWKPGSYSSIPSFSSRHKRIEQPQDDPGKNPGAGVIGISLQIRGSDSLLSADQQVCPPTPIRELLWSSGSVSRTRQFTTFLAACWSTTFTPSASTPSATPPLACCAAARSRSAPSAKASPPPVV